MGWADWCVPSQSDETAFNKELMLRSLRRMPGDELLATAEHLALQLYDTQQIVSRAARRIAELETRHALAAAPPVGAPAGKHRQWARELLRLLRAG